MNSNSYKSALANRFKKAIKDIFRKGFKKCSGRNPSRYGKYIEKCFITFGIPSAVTRIFHPAMATPVDEDTQDPSEHEESDGPPDLTTVTFAHGTNSKQKLRDAIGNTTIEMIEADIVMGTITGANKTKRIPIMAHPPATTSDLSLEQFLKTVLEAPKGIKLDFKSSEAFEASMDILTNFFNDMIDETFPVWLNADILPGPGARDNPGVNATLFLTACATSSRSPPSQLVGQLNGAKMITNTSQRTSTK
uniref:Menorin-like domain-containing protein n=1 Tax=Lygus hesperus TaxID=30085 RepID=A0A0A9XAN4_LYGHE